MRGKCQPKPRLLERVVLWVSHVVRWIIVGWPTDNEWFHADRDMARHDVPGVVAVQCNSAANQMHLHAGNFQALQALAC